MLEGRDIYNRFIEPFLSLQLRFISFHFSKLVNGMISFVHKEIIKIEETTLQMTTIGNLSCIALTWIQLMV